MNTEPPASRGRKPPGLARFVGWVPSPVASKVPEITVLFWLIKVVTTGGGESASDAMVHELGPVVAVAIGASVFAVTFVGERLSPRIPSALVALVGSGFAVVFLHLQAKGVATLQPLPTALPAIALPWSTDTAAVLHAIPIGVIVAVATSVPNCCMSRTSMISI